LVNRESAVTDLPDECSFGHAFRGLTRSHVTPSKPTGLSETEAWSYSSLREEYINCELEESPPQRGVGGLSAGAQTVPCPLRLARYPFPLPTLTSGRRLSWWGRGSDRYLGVAISLFLDQCEFDSPIERRKYCSITGLHNRNVQTESQSV
jgi:hypothetical protein